MYYIQNIHTIYIKRIWENKKYGQGQIKKQNKTNKKKQSKSEIYNV